SKSALPADLDPRSGWSALTTGGFEVIRVEGSHLSMLRPPHLDDMLGKIRELLARVDAAESGGPGTHARRRAQKMITSR
ncbi:MAG TPA: hypothetical protein VGY54_19955, partial [Polyangiaceae bacterium]|nr:hypothetical protein [Polyangiaceae bacterium]